MNGTKQAALLLHGLDPRDAQWVLARLPEAERAALQSHLDELNELGIPADPTLGATLLGRDRSARQRLTAASAERVYLALEHEPAWLIAGLLAAGPWPWQAGLLARAGDARRQMVSAAAPARALPPALQNTLIERVAARLDATVAAAPAAAPARGLASWVRRWIP
ncbi:hypothetical protein [Chitinimonas lacunae]|uniref:DUF2336 domain-containing protein n=1 Tax=Chitinimonas lacunae TaxID=1963018 RepID=A0ABV8MYQ6_9NEIS